jgi:hypothetical protein
MAISVHKKCGRGLIEQIELMKELRAALEGG